MSYIPTLLASIDRRLDELATEITALEGASAALSTPVAAEPKTRRSPNGDTRTRARRPQRRTPAEQAPVPTSSDATTGHASSTATAALEVPTAAAKPRGRRAANPTPRARAARSLSAEELERMLAVAASGLSATEIAQEAEAGYNGILALLRRLESAGRVRRTGSRRTTLWRLITDEERIAERAAELERAASAPGRRRGRARSS